MQSLLERHWGGGSHLPGCSPYWRGTGVEVATCLDAVPTGEALGGGGSSEVDLPGCSPYWRGTGVEVATCLDAVPTGEAVRWR